MAYTNVPVSSLMCLPPALEAPKRPRGPLRHMLRSLSASAAPSISLRNLHSPPYPAPAVPDSHSHYKVPPCRGVEQAESSLDNRRHSIGAVVRDCDLFSGVVGPTGTLRARRASATLEAGGEENTSGRKIRIKGKGSPIFAILF
jgi:hypothetical protein